MLLILMLTVGVVCSCCSCATTNATAIAPTQTNDNLKTGNSALLKNSTDTLGITLSTNDISDFYSVCKVYNSFVDNHFSQNQVTRLEWLEMLFEALGIEIIDGIDGAYSRFVDKDYYEGKEYFETAIQKGILGPGGTKFEPNIVASRQYVSTTLVNAAGYLKNQTLVCNDLNVVKDKKQAAVCVHLGYLDLDENGNFNPYDAITLEQAQYIANELKLMTQLKGKTVMSFGDSIMHGDGNDMNGICDLLSQRYMVEGIDYSYGGSTFGYAIDRQQISNQVLNAIHDHQSADVILVNGGTNDMHKVSAGNIADDYLYGVHGREDFASGMEYVFGLLQDNYPNIPVVYIRAHDMEYANEANELHYGKLALDICEKWKIDVIDMYNDSDFDGHDPEMVKTYTVDTKRRPDGDSVHPNKEGYYTFYIPMVTDKLLQLLTE